jgi:hypothetical protein
VERSAGSTRSRGQVDSERDMAGEGGQTEEDGVRGGAGGETRRDPSDVERATACFRLAVQKAPLHPLLWSKRQKITLIGRQGTVQKVNRGHRTVTIEWGVDSCAIVETLTAESLLKSLLQSCCSQGIDDVPRQQAGWGEDLIVLPCQHDKLPVTVSCLKLTLDYAAAGLILREVNAADNSWIGKITRVSPGHASTRHYLLGIGGTKVLSDIEFSTSLNAAYNEYLKLNLVDTVWKFMDPEAGSAPSAVPCPPQRLSFQQSALKVQILCLMHSDDSLCTKN